MRRLLASPDFRAGFVEMLPACIGLIPFGLVCGVGASAAGASWLAALGMSAVIFSGAAQILAGQMLAGGAPLAIIVLTCFVLGLRFLMYSAAMAPNLTALPPRWQKALAFLLTDQAFASAIRRFNASDDPRGGAQHFHAAALRIARAMREIDACHVQPGADHGEQDGRVVLSTALGSSVFLALPRRASGGT